MEPGVLEQPLVDRRGLVRGVIVQHQVQVQVLRDSRVDELEEPEELLVAVPAVGLRDHRPAADVVGRTGRHGAVRSRAWIWDFSSTARTSACSGGFRYRPTTSRTLAMNSGSVLSFHVSTTCGLSPNARQIRETDDCDSPLSPAIDLVVQCVSWPRPFSVSTRVTTTSTCSSVIVRGAPGRAASARPPTPPSVNRTRHLRTISRDTPVRAATAVSGATPDSSAQASTIRARWASDCEAVRLRTSASRASRSPSVNSRGTGFGPGIRQAYYPQRYLRLKTLAWLRTPRHETRV